MLTGRPACHGVGVKEKWILGGSRLYMQSGEGALGQSKDRWTASTGAKGNGEEGQTAS